MADDWSRVTELFEAALVIPADERESYLIKATANDATLIRRVLELIADDAKTSVLDRAVGDLVRETLAFEIPATAGAGRYRVKHVLGSGGTAIVYYAEHEELGSPVAIKILRDAWVSPDRRARFTREAKMLARLNHPLIARLYGADSLPDGTPYFVMEYVDGEPVNAYCRNRRLTTRKRIDVFLRICESVQVAHREAIVHRDLKPSNVLVADVEGGFAVKLLDFGIARHLDDLDATGNRTQTGQRMMTPAYAAPEQLSGGTVGVYTDVYALGVILYELLTGRRPFELDGLSPAQAERAVLETSPLPPSSAIDETQVIDGALLSKRDRHDLDVVCLKAIAVEPDRRYASVEALARDVEHYLRGEPLEAQREPWSYHAAKYVRRNARPVATTALIVVAIAALTAFYTNRLSDARDAAITEARRTTRIQQFMTGLFEGDPEAGPSDTLRVRTLLGRGVDETRALDTDPEAQADLFETLGTIYHRLGDLDNADSLLAAALDRRRTHFGPGHPEVARNLVGLGLLRVDQGNLDAADSLIAAGLDLSRARLPRGHPDLAAAFAAYGVVLQNRGTYERAAEVQEEAVRMYALDAQNRAAMARILSDLANTYFYAGDYGRSDSLNRLALSIEQDVLGRRHPNVAGTLVNLAATRFNLGHPDEAEVLYRQALEIYLPYYGEDHPMTASNMVLLAQTLATLGRRDEAIALLTPALAVQERALGSDHPRVASTLNELGTVSLANGDHARAESSYRRALAIYRAVHGEEHFTVGIALSNLASVYRDKGDLVASENHMREATVLFARVLADDHIQTSLARLKLGRILLLRDKYEEARAELLAGYEALDGRMDPESPWILGALSDLAKANESLGDSAAAATYRQRLPNR